MDSGNSQPNLSGNGQPIVSGGSQFGNQPQQSQPVMQTSVDSSYNDIILSWKCLNAKAQVNIYIATDNQYKNGGKDNWIKIATVPAKQEQYNIKHQQIPPSKFYKIVIQTENNHLNRWIYK